MNQGAVLRFVVLVLCFAARPLGGQGVVAVGPELEITDLDVAGTPSTAALSSGDFVVVWATYDYELQGRLFAVGGAPQGPAFQINSYTTGGQGGPKVAAVGDDFVVVWGSFVGEPPDIEITVEGQVFEADGTASGSQFEVAPDSPFIGSRSVAATGDSEFVVVWNSYDFVDGYTVRGRRFASDGLPQGDEFQVETYLSNRNYEPLVKSDADGDFVVVWESYGSLGSDSYANSIQARRFTPSGVPLGDQFQVNSQTLGYQDMPALAVAEDGAFVVAWTSTRSYSTEGQRFASDGSPAGGQFRIDGLPGDGREPELASGPGDAFLATWRSPVSTGTDSDDDSIQARFFPAGGDPAEPFFQVNSYTTGEQERPAVAGDGKGRFLVIWREPTIRGQFLATTSVFADGFESGDTTAWPITSP